MDSATFATTVRIARKPQRMRPALMGLMILALTAGGCSDLDAPDTAKGRSGGWAQIRLPNTARPAAYDAGIYAMRQWFRLEETDPERGLIQGAPAEYEQKGGTGRIRDAAIGYKNRMRRTAVMFVKPDAEGCVVSCRVGVQRLDTSDHRVFRDNQRFNDLPNETPIDHDAGIRPSQDQVWTEMPRDREMERQILAIVREQAGEGDAGE
ncbi:MAG: hypothetical protein ABII12_04375 [Planctomycetota bacterium]